MPRSVVYTARTEATDNTVAAFDVARKEAAVPLDAKINIERFSGTGTYMIELTDIPTPVIVIFTWKEEL